MKVRLTFLLTFIVSITGVFAQDTLYSEKALLWEISGNGLKGSSYIFGTVHMIPEDDYFFPDTWKEKLTSCKILALEIDINMSLLEQLAMAQKILLPDGKTLEHYMDSASYLEFHNYIIDSLHVKKSKWNQINKIKPIFSMSLIYEDLIDDYKTYETELNKLAQKNGLQIIGLETADYQIDILNSISIEEQIRILTGGELSGNPLQELNELVNIYKDQDLLRMLDMYKEDDLMMRYENELLIKRNQNWIPKIIETAKKEPVFVAVGAMHLPGTNGVLALLRNEGFIIKPVKN